MTSLFGCQRGKTLKQFDLWTTHSQDKANDVEGNHIAQDLDILVFNET